MDSPTAPTTATPTVTATATATAPVPAFNAENLRFGALCFDDGSNERVDGAALGLGASAGCGTPAGGSYKSPARQLQAPPESVHAALCATIFCYAPLLA